MKKFALLGCAIAVLLQSCSTGNMFTHKRYGHLNWIDHNTKVETGGKAQEPSNEQNSIKTVIQTENKSERTTTYSTAEIEESTNTQISENTEVIPAIENNSFQKNDAVLHESDQTEPVIENSNTPKQIIKPSSSVKEIQEGSTGELLLMAVLIALAIIIFFLLDSALGGILSLILIIFLILVLLRYFGVI